LSVTSNFGANPCFLAGGGCYACRTRAQLRRGKEHDFTTVTIRPYRLDFDPALMQGIWLCDRELRNAFGQADGT
jgi:hypothetical protein